jgi:hypothetical protein
MARRSSLIPYHFIDARGSKRFVIEAPHRPASFFASRQPLLPEINRRHADYRDVYAFGLKANAAVKAKVPVLLT